MSTHASRLHSLRRLAFSLLAGSIFTTITAAAGSPRVHETLDFGWRFLQGDAPEATNAAFNDSGWRTVDVPHDWSIEGDFNRTNAMSAASGYLPSGIGWYRQTITAPPAWSGKRVMVEFEGVYMNADVWLNGEHLGFHPYGYNYALRNAPADHTRAPSHIIVCTESLPRATFESWSHVHDESFVIGDFVWTAIDYIGEAAIGRYSYSTDTNTANRGFGGRTTQLYPWNGSFCGDLDLAGFRKPISHYRNIIFERGEKLYMAVREPEINGRTIRLGNNWSLWPMSENWTWPGLEGTNISVEVYSTAEKVQLYLNDKLIGEQPTTRTQQFMATFKAV